MKIKDILSNLKSKLGGEIKLGSLFSGLGAKLGRGGKSAKSGKPGKTGKTRKGGNTGKVGEKADKPATVEKTGMSDFDEDKLDAMEKLLGQAYEKTGQPPHAFSHKGEEPGELERYYFPHPLLSGGGTGFATMELMTANGKGPKNPDGYYELVAFTKNAFTGSAYQVFSKEDLQNDTLPEPLPDTPYNRAEGRIWDLLNAVTREVTHNKLVLKAGDTLELPAGSAGPEPTYLFFARYSSRVKPFFSYKRMSAHLILVMELSGEDFAKAQKVGNVNMTNYLKGSGRWPYTLELDG